MAQQLRALSALPEEVIYLANILYDILKHKCLWLNKVYC